VACAADAAAAAAAQGKGECTAATASRHARSNSHVLLTLHCTAKVLTKANITLCEGEGDDLWVAVKHVRLPEKFSAEQCRTVLQVWHDACGCRRVLALRCAC